MAKTTSLYVAVAVLACRNFSLIVLLEVYGFKSAIVMAYGYDESRVVYPKILGYPKAEKFPNFGYGCPPTIASLTLSIVSDFQSLVS